MCGKSDKRVPGRKFHGTPVINDGLRFGNNTMQFEHTVFWDHNSQPSASFATAPAKPPPSLWDRQITPCGPVPCLAPEEPPLLFFLFFPLLYVRLVPTGRFYQYFNWLLLTYTRIQIFALFSANCPFRHMPDYVCALLSKLNGLLDYVMPI